MKNNMPRYTKEPPGIAAAIRDSIVVKDFLPPPEVLHNAPRVLIKSGTGKKKGARKKLSRVTKDR